MDGSLNGGTPISHPKMIVFSRSLPIVVGETHHFRKPPIYFRYLYIFNPIGSMYGIFTYIYHTIKPNVGKYTIHGSSGNYMYVPYCLDMFPWGSLERAKNHPWIFVCLTLVVAEERKSGSTILGMEYTMIHQHVWEVVPFFGFCTHRRMENLRTSPMKSSIFDIGICFSNHRSSKNWKQISNVKCQATPWQWRWSSQQLREVLRGGAFDLGGVQGHEVMKFGCCYWEVGKSLHPKDHWTFKTGVILRTLPLRHTGSNPSIGGSKILRACV